MPYTFKNHPTRYKNTLFRSRLEARWAAFFDLRGWQWQYEPLDLSGWTPDFLVHILPGACSPSLLNGSSHEILIEVKPFTVKEQFSNHPLVNYPGHWSGPIAECAFGVGINPSVSTEGLMASEEGGGLFTFDDLCRDWADDWAEAGNITRYQPPKEIQ